MDKTTTSVLNPTPGSLIDAIQLSPIAVAKSSPLRIRDPLRPSDIRDEDEDNCANTDEDTGNDKEPDSKKSPQPFILETASVTWLDLGPLVPPCLSVAFQSEHFLRVSIAALDLPLYKNDYNDEYDERNRVLCDTTAFCPLSILCEGQYRTTQSSLSSSLQHAPTLSTDIYSYGSLGSMLCHQSNGDIIVMYPTLGSGKQKHDHSKSKATATLQMNNSQLLSVVHPVASAALGITDTGFVLGDDDNTDDDKYNDDAYGSTRDSYDDILHVHSNLHCQIIKQQQELLSHSKDSIDGGGGESLSLDMETDGHRNWGIPTMRYWLCKTKVGDKKDYTLNNKGGTTSNTLQQQRAVAAAAAAAAASSQEGDFPTGGATLSVICELTCGDSSSPQQQPKPLIPHRISRDATGKHCAVLFRSRFEPKKGRLRPARIYADPILFLIVNTTTTTITKGGGPTTTTALRHGRDVVFLTRLQRNRPRYLSLKTNGTSLEEVLLTDNDDDTINNRDNSRNYQDKCVHEVPIFPRGAVEESSIEIHRLFVTSKSKSSSRIFFVGSDRSNGQYCLFYGVEWTDHSALSASVLKAGNDLAKLWFHHGERVLSLIELPLSSKGSKRDNHNHCGNIAVATTARVLILSPSPPRGNSGSNDNNMTIIAEKRGGALLTCASLVPIGSHCVAFFEFLSTNRTSGGARMTYLSCLPHKPDHPRHQPRHRPRVIATLPSPRYSYASSYLLLAVRPDRFLYISSQSGSRLTAKEQVDRTLLSPIPCTKPICLLEPLVANALCCQGNDEECRRNAGKLNLMETVIERFGRKSLSIPHGDKEGIGTLGAGITTALYDLLIDHHHHDGVSDGDRALSYLIKGYNHHNATTKNHHTSDPLAPSSSGSCLPLWIPATTKAKASKTCAGALHAFASGDHYLKEYLRIATETVTTASTTTTSNTTSPNAYIDDAAPVMPRPIDPTSALSRKFSKSALDKGNILDAVRFLDLSGSPSSERDLTLILLSLQLLITATTIPTSSSSSSSSSLVSSSSSSSSTKAKANIVEDLLVRLCGNAAGRRGTAASTTAGGGSGGQCHGSSTSSICAIVLALRIQNQKNISRQITSQLAPSFQKGCCTTRRSRNLLLGSSFLVGMGQLIQDKEVEEGESKSMAVVNADYGWKNKTLEEANNIW